jgi:hypothetical protein
MPKKPTAFTQKAVSDLTTLIAKLKPHEPLPPLRTLARRLEVHASTVCRLLKDFADEGKAWRSPSGRYFAATERGAGLRGLSLCFIGREMHHWSQLYQELLEGISEVCSANEGNLVLVSSPRLLSQSSPAEVRSILPPRNQGAEIQRLIERLPQGLAGLVFDHLWDEDALALARLPRMEARALLLPPTGKLGCASPNYDQGAELSLAHAQHCGYTEFVVVHPFTGDPSIDAIIKSFTTVARSWPVRIATPQSMDLARLCSAALNCGHVVQVDILRRPWRTSSRLGFIATRSSTWRQPLAGSRAANIFSAIRSSRSRNRTEWTCLLIAEDA